MPHQEVINISYSLHSVGEEDTYVTEILNIIKKLPNFLHLPDNQSKISVREYNNDTDTSTHIHIILCDVTNFTKKESTEIINKLLANMNYYVHFLFFSHSNIIFPDNVPRLINEDMDKMYKECIDLVKRITFNLNRVTYSPIYSKVSGDLNDIKTIMNRSIKHIGHTLLKDEIQKILKNYSNIICHDIEKELMCMKVDLNDSIDQLRNIKNRINRLKYVDNKNIIHWKVIILLEKRAEEICEHMCRDVITNNTYNLSDYDEKIKFLISISSSDTMLLTQNLINKTKYKKLNENLEKMFDIDVFLELYENNELSDYSYMTSIYNTLKENMITADSLLELINSVSQSHKVKRMTNLVIKWVEVKIDITSVDHK